MNDKHSRTLYRIQTQRNTVPHTNTAEHCTAYKHSRTLYRIQTRRNTVPHTNTAEHCTAYKHSRTLYRIQTQRNTVPYTNTAEQCTAYKHSRTLYRIQTQRNTVPHYRATRKNLDSRKQLDEPVECASGRDPLLLYKILHLLFFFPARILCAIRLESRKKNYQYFLDAGPLEFQFLRPRGCLTNPFRTLSLCFGVIGKTPGLVSALSLLTH